MNRRLTNEIRSAAGKSSSGGKGGAPEVTLDKSRKRGVILRLGGYILRYWPMFLAAIAFTLLSNQLSLLGPRFSGAAIDAIAAEGGVDFEAVAQNVGMMIVCYILSAVLSYILAALMIVIGQRITYTMRRQLFDKLMSLPVGYFDTHAVGDIISRLSYDIDTVNSSLSHDLVQIMTSIYTVVGSLMFMWSISRPLVAIFAVTVPITVIVTRYRAKKVNPLYKKRSALLGELNGYAEEMISGLGTIRAYHREDEIGSRFARRNSDAMDAYCDADIQNTSLGGPINNFINNISLSLVMMFGGALYMFSQAGTVAPGSLFFLGLGDVGQFVQYSRKFTGPINEYSNIIGDFQSAIAAADRIFRVLDENPEPLDALGASELDRADTRGEVGISHISFGYTPERLILRDLDVTALPGKTVAIVGPTGAGKTTIINLLMRFYDVDSGEISIDGVPITDIRRDSLRSAYTMVLQDTWLFYGTIFENIAYGKEGATLEQVKAAARAARIDTYIERLPQGYDTVLSDDGVNISKGQRQLITIARAMLSDGRILILDEATSNVDSRTEIKIQQSLSDLMQNRTCFVIAHRLSTIQNADLILVLRDGTVTESGTHAQLMSRGGFYSTLYNSQYV